MEKLIALLNSLQVPLTYDHFAEGEANYQTTFACTSTCRRIGGSDVWHLRNSFYLNFE